MTATILSIGVATPTGQLSADRAVALATQLTPPLVPATASQGSATATRDTPSRLESLHRRAGVDRRACAILDDLGCQSLYTPDPTGHGPSLSQRLSSYTHHAARLALAASRDALERADLDPASITHLVTASCTGFDAPGFDQRLIAELPLTPSVRRTHIGFMGCHAAVNALAVADAFASAHPDATVLLCCSEICSLHYHFSHRIDQIISNALFADGAAAAILNANPSASKSAPPLPTLAGFASAIFPDSAHAMSWRIGDHGFEMSLAASVPATLHAHLPQWLNATLHQHSLSPQSVGAWAIHPGGPRIVAAVAGALHLSPAHTDPSLQILRQHGNMSSPTILFILRQLWTHNLPRPWVALAFGPGLAAECAILK